MAVSNQINHSLVSEVTECLDKSESCSKIDYLVIKWIIHDNGISDYDTYLYVFDRSEKYDPNIITCIEKSIPSTNNSTHLANESIRFEETLKDNSLLSFKLEMLSKLTEIPKQRLLQICNKELVRNKNGNLYFVSFKTDGNKKAFSLYWEGSNIIAYPERYDNFQKHFLKYNQIPYAIGVDYTLKGNVSKYKNYYRAYDDFCLINPPSDLKQALETVKKRYPQSYIETVQLTSKTIEDNKQCVNLYIKLDTTMDKYYQLKKHYVFRDIGGVFFLVDISEKNYYKSAGLKRLNNVAAVIFKSLSDYRMKSFDYLYLCLLREIKVENEDIKKQIEEDLNTFLSQAEDEEIIERVK